MKPTVSQLVFLSRAAVLALHAKWVDREPLVKLDANAKLGFQADAIHLWHAFAEALGFDLPTIKIRWTPQPEIVWCVEGQIQSVEFSGAVKS